MKIAIVTVYQPFTNLGSFLQAFALKTYLEEKGNEVKFVKTSHHIKEAISLVTHFRPARSFISRCKKLFIGMCDLNRLQFTSEDLANFDCCIWGSDEIWNVTNPFFRKPIFWGAGTNNIPKLGYAISAGHATENDFKLYEILTDKIKEFNKIFSRDLHTKTLLKNIYGIDTDSVIDPTLIVSVKKLSEPIKLPSEKYLLVYTYGLDSRIVEFLRVFAHKENLKIISPCFWHIWVDKTIECSALQFSTLIANAEYVFTTTFHGAIFALINHTRCCILPTREKVRNVCQILGCTDRLISDIADYSTFDSVIKRPFDSRKFEDRLSQLRRDSQNILDKVLATCKISSNI